MSEPRAFLEFRLSAPSFVDLDVEEHGDRGRVRCLIEFLREVHVNQGEALGDLLIDKPDEFDPDATVGE